MGENKMNLILNTWIFESAVKEGTTQTELVDRVAKLGVDGIEVRREYFTDIAQETKAVGEHAKQQGLIVNYSVPDEVFLEDGTINPKLKQYFDEGSVMGISKIKFNTGHFDRFTGDLKEAFEGLPLDRIEMNVENDQTPVSGTVKAIKTFLDAAHDAGLVQLGYVYDLGNWGFTHGDAVQSAKDLAKYTHYIHLKNTIDQDGTMVTSDDLNTGMFDWKDIISFLPHDVSFALEYPMKDDEQILEQIKVFRAGVGE